MPADVAIVEGVRTPFCKAGTSLHDQEAVDLARACVAELMARTGLRPSTVDRVVFGQVVPSLDIFNIAREVVLGTELPRTTDAFSVSRACATSYQAITSAAEAIRTQDATCVVAGGAESASNLPIGVSDALAQVLTRASRATTIRERVRELAELRPGDFRPRPPALAEPSTGLTMGQSAERMAKRRGISRTAQDDLAHRSHVLAARAWAEGKLAAEVMTMFVGGDEPRAVEGDNLVRVDSNRNAYSELEPVFDRRHGTITAGNSSPLTDGGSATLLMNAERADAEGLRALAHIRAHAYVAVDPADELLIGPAQAIPRVLRRAGMTLSDVDLLDLHEAFAAQVLAVIDELEREGGAAPRGGIDWDRLNVGGGSIAMGHPFAATGSRQINQMVFELRRRGGGVGLCSACAAGGLAGAIIVEVQG